jgi:hypothetical protein
MQNLPRDVLREIARRVGMRNRTALEVTSRTMRAAARPVTAEITQETRAGLCRALKIAFGFRRMLETEFTEDQVNDIAFTPAIERAGRAYAAKVKGRAQPGKGAEIAISFSFMEPPQAPHLRKFGGHVLEVRGLFIGYVNETRVQVDARIKRDHFSLYARGLSGGPVLVFDSFSPDFYVTVGSNGIVIQRPTRFFRGRTHNALILLDPLKRKAGKEIRLFKSRAAPGGKGRRARVHRAHLVELLEEALENSRSPGKRNVKVAGRAIKACATSLHASMW